MVSDKFVICPYCKNENYKTVAIGTSGLVNAFGTERTVECRKCGEEFRCEVEVKIRYKTSKFNTKK